MRMMTVERQLPRNMRIISPTSAAASAASRMTPNTAALTKTDWSPTALQIEARRQALLDPRQQRLDAVDDAQRRGRAGLEDRHQHRARAVDAHQVGLRRRALMHVGDVAHVDDRAVDLLHRQVVDPFEQDRAGVERDVPVELADLLVAGRQDQVLRRDRR